MKFVEYLDNIILLNQNKSKYINQMIEDKNKHTNIKPTGKSLYLDTVIDCITDKNNSPHKKTDNNNQEMNINHLYDKAGKIIENLDTQINKCIKYKQARINRDYQIIITDLQSEIKKLSEKLKLEQDARSPTKKHISDLLDKLVIFRDENIRLKQEIQSKDQKIKQLQTQISMQVKALQKIQTQQPKTLIQRLPAINSTSNLPQEIKNFLKDKDVVKKITKKSTSKLQKFLLQNKTKSWNWTIPVLLEQLQKWGEGVSQEKHEVDMWRIRSSIANKFSNLIDDSGTLTKPSRMNSLYSSQANSARQEKNLTSRRASNFSYHGSKQKLNFSYV